MNTPLQEKTEQDNTKTYELGPIVTLVQQNSNRTNQSKSWKLGREIGVSRWVIRKHRMRSWIISKQDMSRNMHNLHPYRKPGLPCLRTLKDFSEEINGNGRLLVQWSLLRISRAYDIRVNVLKPRVTGLPAQPAFKLASCGGAELHLLPNQRIRIMIKKK